MNRNFNDLVLASDGAVARFQPVFFEDLTWRTEWSCEQWSEEACEWVRRKLGLDKVAAVSSELLRKFVRAEVEIDAGGNLLLNEGIQELEDLLMAVGGATVGFTNAVSQMGVGDSTTAEAATQTDLQAGVNFLFKAMNATYPSRASQTITFQSDFTTAEANFAWQEMSIRNGVTRNKNLNRKVTSLGTKATGTWTLTGTVAIS